MSRSKIIFLGGASAASSITLPGSSTNKAAVRWSGAGGATVQDSSVVIGDLGELSGISSITSTGPSITTANALGALAINVAKGLNTKSISADSVFTFSATPAANTWFSLYLINTDTANHTITIPSSFSQNSQSTITTFTILAGGQEFLTWRYDGSAYQVFGVPSASWNISVPSVDGTSTGPTLNAFNCGYSSSAVGDLVYLDSSATWQKCDANTLALYNGLLGIAMEVKASAAALTVALPGSFVYATGFPTFTIGSPIYMSETAGAVTHTAPTTTDAASRIVGWGIHADKMFFFPSPDYTTHT